MAEGIIGYLLEPGHGMVYRWICVSLAIGAAAIMGLVLWDSLPTRAHPKPPFVYHYQWPPLWGQWRYQVRDC